MRDKCCVWSLFQRLVIPASSLVMSYDPREINITSSYGLGQLKLPLVLPSFRPFIISTGVPLVYLLCLCLLQLLRNVPVDSSPT